MSRKKRVQLISIIFLLMSIFLYIPSTQWHSKISVIAFTSLLVGILGSICSIFIPKTYTKHFSLSDWQETEQGDFRLIIPASLHGMGKSPRCKFFTKDENEYSYTLTSYNTDKKGNITITAHHYKGKVVIS